MKKIKMTSVFFISIVYSGTLLAGWTDLLNQANDAADTVQNTTSTIDNISNTVKTGQVVQETAATGLVDTLVKQLGVTSAQAQGGSGILFQQAKNKMSASDFSQLSQSVPGMDGMLAAAPKAQPTSATGNLLSGLAAVSGNSTLTNASSLLNAFQQLDLSQGMMSQFTPVIVDYVKQNSGENMANLLKAALATAP